MSVCVRERKKKSKKKEKKEEKNKIKRKRKKLKERKRLTVCEEGEGGSAPVKHLIPVGAVSGASSLLENWLLRLFQLGPAWTGSGDRRSNKLSSTPLDLTDSP